jgi:hypothetical protein
MIGVLEMNALTGGGLVAYSEDVIQSDISPNEHLIEKLYQLESFLLMLWLLKDNAINTEMAFAIHRQDGHLSTSSNLLGNVFSMSSGKKPSTRYSVDEVKDAARLYRKSISIPSRPFERKTTQLVSGSKRISRASYFVQAARSSWDLTIKVANYCSAMEAMFASSQAELAHQLSERVACYLGDSLDARLDVYRQVKEAYGIRSKVVHGSTVKEGEAPKIIQAANNCDLIMREVLVRVIGDAGESAVFDLAAPEFDKYFQERVFSGK